MAAAIPQIVPLVVGDSPSRPLNVLILDDMETDRVRIRRLCRKAGLEFQHFEAGDLASFRRMIDQQPMDLVFIDYNLDMDTGFDALRILAAHEDQAGALPIMITSVDRPDVVIEAMRGGCADYLIKEQLSVEAMRKSIASSFERRILISAITESQTSRHATRLALGRFARTSGPELRSSLAATLRHIRSVRGSPGIAPAFADRLNSLENGCQDVFGFLDEVKALLDAANDEAAPAPMIGRG